jgi:hypothetical protein
MTLNHQAALGARTSPRPASRTGANQRRGSRRRGQLSRRLRYITLSGPPVKRILPIAAIVVGLAASAAWTAFLGYQLFRVTTLVF